MASVSRSVLSSNHPGITIPLFLCPLFASRIRAGCHRGQATESSRPKSRVLHTEPVTLLSQHPSAQCLPTALQLAELPTSCPGCGAFAQTVSSDQPGFYGSNRKSVRAFIARNVHSPNGGYQRESEVFDIVIGTVEASVLNEIGLAGLSCNEFLLQGSVRR